MARNRNLKSALGLGNEKGLDIKALAKLLKIYGRDGDTMLVHITPEEVEFLKKMGGRGTLNPKTGVYEFAPVADNPSKTGFFGQPNVDYNAVPVSTQTGGGPSGQGDGSPYTLSASGFFGGEKLPPTPYGEQGQNPGWGHEGQPLVIQNNPSPMINQTTSTSTNSVPTTSSATTTAKSSPISNAYISPTIYKQVQNPDFQQILLRLLQQQAARYR